MPVDKAIFWPLSQEFASSHAGAGFAREWREDVCADQAPLRSKGLDQAPFLSATFDQKTSNRLQAMPDMGLREA
ncbi:hypothetical protein [Pseudomonas prosekii]|uniref:hypothetical protein n=1 Tax=Pseudomonas prosekii TaxID=1148509 RepID=UPI0016568D8D|nr:hypothetical protein [Pseudomonas prosekii]